MKKVVLLSILTLLLVPALFGADEAKVAKADSMNIEIDADLFASLDKAIESHIDQKIYPGAVIAVGRPGHFSYVKAYGHHTYDADAKPMQLNTVFDLASVSKAVGTATMTMLLIQDGVLSLDVLVSKYIPGFDSKGKEGNTVKDLLTHVSGLKAYENYNKINEAKGADETNADAMIRHIANLEASYEPRTDYKYSCLNFLTLARLNQEAAGLRQEDFLRMRVWEPLGMNDTFYIPTADQLERTAPTIKRKDGDFVGPTHDPLSKYHGSEGFCPGNAGLFSTAPDLAKYCEMLLSDGTYQNHKVYKPEIIQAMTKIQTPSAVDATRGLGYDIWDTPPHAMKQNHTDDTYTFGHTGYTGTLIWMDKLSKVYIVHLTNRVYPDDKASVSGARKDVLRIVLGGVSIYKDELTKDKDEEEKKGN